MAGRIVFTGLMPHAPVLVPGVGRVRVSQVEATAHAMDLVARHAVAGNPDTILLISPHSPRQSGAFGLWYTQRLRGSLAEFGAPESKVDLPLDGTFADQLEVEAERRGLLFWRIVQEPLDHGAVVPLRYLAAAGWNGPTVILGLNYPGQGGLDELGQAIAATAQRLKRRTAVIASGDMSHRLTRAAPAGYDPVAHRFDETFVNLLRQGSFEQLQKIDPVLQAKAAEDVLDSTQVAVAAADYKKTGHELLSYEGPFGVGYGVAILYEPKKEESNGTTTSGSEGKIVTHFTELPAVARSAVTAKLQQVPTQPRFRARGEVAEPGAVFVTARNIDGALRGCRGVIAPLEKNIVLETWHSAVAAALYDLRFPAVTAAELPRLRFSVSILGSLEPVTDTTTLDPAVYGILLSTNDGRKGVLLPALADIETVEMQLSIARQKAGINPYESFAIERFTVRNYAEQPDTREGEVKDAAP